MIILLRPVNPLNIQKINLRSIIPFKDFQLLLLQISPLFAPQRLKIIQVQRQIIIKQGCIPRFLQLIKRIQAERDQFDEELEAETQKKLAAIKKEADERMEQVMAEQREKNSFMLEHLQKEYDGNHELYAKEIVRRIVEV